MRLKWAWRIYTIGLGLGGGGALAAAFFAVELGLDTDRKMGGQRSALALLGGLSLLLAALPFFLPTPPARALLAGLGRLWQRVDAALRRLDPFFARLQASRFARRLGGSPAAWGGFGVGLAILAALWYLTSGTGQWTPYSHYFDRQAEAFLAGQLALLEQPPAALLALPNPYDWRSRESVPGYLWDASLYRGKYYLYWGPVPALLAAGIKGLLGRGITVEDQALLFTFFAGTAAALALALARLRRQYFPAAPAWTLALFTLAGCLGAPFFWLVNRPNVYETAIAGGQFFLVLGLWALLGGLQGKKAWLALAGLAWGAAIGCRVNNLAAIAWMAGLAGLFWLRSARRPADFLLPVACLLLPLAAWGAGLGWYNWARFGSLLETGHRYQLTGIALPADYGQVASPGYLLPNLYNLLARPFELDARHFPFVLAPYLTGQMWPGFIKLPPLYYFSEPIAGILVSLPVIWLALAPALGLLRAGWAWLNSAPSTALPVRAARKHTILPFLAANAAKNGLENCSPPLGRGQGWVWAMLAGGLAANLLSLSIFITSSMRYTADLALLAVLLSALSLWWALEQLRGRPALRFALLALAAGLGLVTLAAGLLVNFQNGDKRFEALNPALYHAIARFFEGR